MRHLLPGARLDRDLGRALAREDRRRVLSGLLWQLDFGDADDPGLSADQRRCLDAWVAAALAARAEP